MKSQFKVINKNGVVHLITDKRDIVLSDNQCLTVEVTEKGEYFILERKDNET